MVKPNVAKKSKAIRWRKVQSPKSWHPESVKDELVGYYGGQTTKSGEYGQYQVALIHVPEVGSFMMTGTRIIQLIDAAMVQPGHPIKVIWEGLKPTSQGRQMKDFTVFVAEGESIPVAELPILKLV